jgi:DNA primase
MLVPPSSPGFPTDFKELVRSRTDLVELVGETVTLQPKGREFVGLCPFHDDSNPSLTVSPERQSYKCWSCGEGGDCFSFVMKTQAFEFPVAVRFLAERAHIEIPQNHRGGNSAASDLKKRLYGILKWAENEFHHFLLEAREAQRARDYLASRGFDKELITKFRIGYHPNDWTWLQVRASGRYKPEDLAGAQLLSETKDGRGYIDKMMFMDRVMFPIHDARGRAVAFGGRILPDSSRADSAKYINSSDSQVFSKSNLLYAYGIARESIRRSKTAIVVEGYTDCITLHQHGLGSAVATLGTSLTDSHVSLLKRLAHRVVLLYDGDEAGQRATERALSMFLAQKLDLRVLTLPEGMDPADFIAERGADELRERIDSATEAWEHKLLSSIARNGLDSIDGSERVQDEMLELMAVVPGLAGDSREDILLNRLAQRTSGNEQQVRRRLARLRRNKSERGQGQGGPENSHNPQQPQATGLNDAGGPVLANQHQRWECDLLEIIFAAPESVATIRSELEPAEFTQQRLRTILEVCFDLSVRGVEPNYERVTAEVEEADLKRLSLWIEEESRDKDVARKLRMDRTAADQEGKRPRFLEQAIQNLKWRREEASHAKSKGQLSELSPSGGGMDEDAIELLRRQTEFHQRRATRKPAY